MPKEMVAPEVAPVEVWSRDKVVDEVAKWLTEPGYSIPWPEIDPEVSSAEINRRILEAEDPFATESELQKAREILGLPFRLTGFGIRPSDPASGAKAGGAYVIIEGHTNHGEAILFQTGAKKVVTKLIAAERKHKMGAWVQIVLGNEGKRSNSGYEFLDLVPAPEPFPES